MTIETFVDHVARWVEVGYIHSDVWRCLRKEVARDALPLQIDTDVTLPSAVVTAGPLNKGETELECKISMILKIYEKRERECGSVSKKKIYSLL